MSLLPVRRVIFVSGDFSFRMFPTFLFSVLVFFWFSVIDKAPTLIYRARQLYNNKSMLFLFPVKDGKLSTGVIAIFNASCYG